MSIESVPDLKIIWSEVLRTKVIFVEQFMYKGCISNTKAKLNNLPHTNLLFNLDRSLQNSGRQSGDLNEPGKMVGDDWLDQGRAGVENPIGIQITSRRGETILKPSHEISSNSVTAGGNSEKLRVAKQTF